MHCTGNVPLTLATFSSAPSLFEAYFCPGMSLFWSVLSSFPACSVPAISQYMLVMLLRLALQGASFTLFKNVVFCTSFSSTVTLSSVTDMALNRPTVFDNNFVKGTFSMPDDSVFYAGLCQERFIVPGGIAVCV